MPSVELIPMTEIEFASWAPEQIIGYAKNKVRVGVWPEDGSLERSRKEMSDLLPDGPRTPTHRIFKVVDNLNRQVVGNLWVKVSEPSIGGSAFIYNIEVNEEHRGRGYGAAILMEVEGLLAAEGYARLSLHVFGFNEGAQRFYKRMGFEVVGINMARTISR